MYNYNYYYGNGGIKIAVRVTEQADDVIDAAKTVKRASNSTSDTKTAFVEEYALMTQKGVNNADTYNKIWSPVNKIYHNGGGK